MAKLIMIFAGVQGKARAAATVMMVVYSSLLLAVLVLGAPWWLLRMVTSGRYRAGLTGRLGRVPEGLRAAVAGQNVIWLHAVSVGEVMAATQLIRELKAKLPGWVVAVSTTTETGQRLAVERLGGERLGAESPVFYLPLDFAFVVRRYLRVMRPKMLVLMESELWPRLIDECAKSAVPMVVVNARVSDRSFPRYMRLRRLWRPLLGKISLFLAQSAETAERLVRMGAPVERVRVTGNLKYDIRVGGKSLLAEMLRERLVVGARVVVCGSTLEGEERMLLEAWTAALAGEPRAVMVLAPRHPDRFAAVAGMVAASGFGLVRASEFRERPGAANDRVAAGSVFLLDTIGDLAAMYGLGAVAFVGGSLVPKGGHNPLEPAQFGVPVVMGPSYENFREIVEVMRESDAVRIVSTASLGAAMVEMLQDGTAARALGDRGRAVFEAQAGATARTVEALLGLLGETAVKR
jgi:3-deoxy-D-manno-octulosonic-acid transferase